MAPLCPFAHPPQFNALWIYEDGHGHRHDAIPVVLSCTCPKALTESPPHDQRLTGIGRMGAMCALAACVRFFCFLFLVAGFRSSLSSLPARVVILLGGIQSLRRAPVGARRRYPSLTSTQRRLVVWQLTHSGAHTFDRKCSGHECAVQVRAACAPWCSLKKGDTSTFSASTKSVFWLLSFRIECDNCSQSTVLVRSAAMIFASRI
jgi:hypothetical protein